MPACVRAPATGPTDPKGNAMPAVQERLPLPRALPARVRPSAAIPPVAGEGPYRLPHDVRDRLAAALAPFRNREAAFALAVFLARFWCMPGRVALPFPIDRRALAGHRELGLTEARVRGAIRVLEEVGFLARFVTSGSRYKATEDGPAPQADPVPVRVGLCPAVHRGQQAGCGGPWPAGGRSPHPDTGQRPRAVCGLRRGSRLSRPKTRAKRNPW